MIENMEVGKLFGRRAELFEEADGDERARAILSDTQGVVIEFYKFRDDEDRRVNTARLQERGFGSFEVGQTTVFHIDREEDDRRVRQYIES